MKKGSVNPHLFKARIGDCLVCSKEFRAVKDFKDRKQKYCSKICWSSRAPAREATCLYCKINFKTYEKTKKYCTKKCDGLHRRILMKGANSHFWEGGKTKITKILRTSAEYKEWRKMVFERDNYTCISCRSKCSAGRKVELQADHIKPVCKRPDLMFDVDNGRTLCRECHKLTDTWGYKSRWEKLTKLKAELLT